jgi:cell division protein FtsB
MRKNIGLKKTLNSKTTVLGLLVVFIIIVFSLSKNISSQKSVNHQITALEEEIKATQNENSEFQDLIKYFSSAEYIEMEARQKLNLGQAGEKAIIISNAKKTDENQTDNQSATTTFKSSPQRWWQYFFN